MVLIEVLAALVAFAGADASAADFARHPAPAVYHGPRAPLQFRDARSRRLRSALEDAYDHPIDFAGRFVLAEVGCGAGCIEAAALDVRTGKVFWLAKSVSDWPKDHLDPIERRVDSRLVVVHGRLGERGGAGPHAFVFDGQRFSPR